MQNTWQNSAAKRYLAFRHPIATINRIKRKNVARKATKIRRAAATMTMQGRGKRLAVRKAGFAPGGDPRDRGSPESVRGKGRRK